jgi:effector-binding domain-containing protein
VLAENNDVNVIDLPVVEVASVLHRGALVDITETFEALVRWIEANGYRIADRSRELYLAADLEDPAQRVTEIQLPIAPA